MKKIIYLFAFFLLTLPATAQQEYGLKFSSLISDNLSLENAIRLGLENNSDFLTARQEIIVAEQKVNEAKFQFLPQLALQGTATWYDLDYPMVLPDSVANRFLPGASLADKSNQFFGVGVTATQYLYSGGRIRNTLKIARANLKQLQSRYEAIKNATVLDIKKSFYNLLFAQEYNKLIQQVSDQVTAWNIRSSGDVWAQMRIQSALARLQVRHHEATRQLAQARLAMLVSLNKETNADLSITGDFSPVRVDKDLAQLNLRAMEYRPELKSALYALELDNIAIDLALSKRYPDIILNGTYEQLGDDSLGDTNKQISLAVRLPLPYNFSSQISQKKAQQQKSTLRRAMIEDKIRVEVARSFEEVRFWQNEVLSRQEQFTTLKNLFDKAERSAAKQGAAPIEAALFYTQTAYDYLDALRHNLTAKAELEWAVGQDL
ncbi:TolC family protein [Candidatus Avelusimicrobium luingense]|uniref:TolC family protein n=1 Tax=Candidatus Avelusimicrobium luingense TaxID=3416211 RepID=UPI003D0C21EA